MEAPCLLDFCENPPDKDTKTGRCQESEDNSGRKRHGHRDAGGPVTGEPPRGRQGTGYRPGATKGVENRNGNCSRHRPVARDAGTSGGGWRATAGVDKVQVGGALHRESMWGAGGN